MSVVAKGVAAVVTGVIVGGSENVGVVFGGAGKGAVTEEVHTKVGDAAEVDEDEDVEIGDVEVDDVEIDDVDVDMVDDEDVVEVTVVLDVGEHSSDWLLPT